VTGGAGTGFFTGMLDLDTIFQGSIAYRNTRFGLNHQPFGANLFVGQKNNLRH
jgi:TRAP-type C4-dicarboxylate transport system permease large subunit